jgi:hypothetical protein
VGCNRNVRILESEDPVVEEVNENSLTLLQQISRQMGLPRSTVHRVLKDQGLHPFHYTKVHRLTPDDHRLRVRFCEWILDRCNEEPNFAAFMLWFDEAMFSREGVVNMHNEHNWALENPHVVCERAFQEQWSVSVWAGILNDRVMGSCLLPDRLCA